MFVTRYHLFQSSSTFGPVRPRLYIASFSILVYAATSIGFLLALVYENLLLRASIQANWPRRCEGPIIYTHTQLLREVCVSLLFRDMRRLLTKFPIVFTSNCGTRPAT